MFKADKLHKSVKNGYVILKNPHVLQQHMEYLQN